MSPVKPPLDTYQRLLREAHELRELLRIAEAPAKKPAAPICGAATGAVDTRLPAA